MAIVEALLRMGGTYGSGGATSVPQRVHGHGPSLVNWIQALRQPGVFRSDADQEERMLLEEGEAFPPEAANGIGTVPLTSNDRRTISFPRTPKTDTEIARRIFFQVRKGPNHGSSSSFSEMGHAIGTSRWQAAARHAHTRFASPPTGLRSTRSEDVAVGMHLEWSVGD